jgi:uncharacterized membrane protein
LDADKDQDNMNKDQKTLLQIYVAYLISLICNIIPSSTVQTFGMILFIIIFIATYFYRSKSEENSLINTHMQYIIKNIWISSMFLIIGMIAAYLLADHSIINQTMNAIQQGIIPSEDQINDLLLTYFKFNIFVFIATLSPSLIYLAYRLINGMVKAKENSPIINLKNWF